MSRGFIFNTESYIVVTDEHLQATVSARGVIVEPGGQILVLQRATDGQWELPGGRLAPGEATVQGLQREITEETTLAVDMVDILSANSWINDDEEGRFAVHYECSISNRDVETSSEHTNFRWIAPTDAHSMLCEPQTVAVHAATRPTEVTRPPIDRSFASPD